MQQTSEVGMEASGGRPANWLLAALPPEAYARLVPHLEREEFRMREVLYEPYAPIHWVHFPESGIFSLLKVLDEGPDVEVATVGNEGLVGISAYLGNDGSPLRVFCQASARTLRIPVAVLQDEAARSSPLQRVLNRYTLALMSQLAQSGACNRAHAIEQRLARWLLLSHDRIPGDDFELTQHFMAQMLGVHRPAVTVAAASLQKAGLIRYRRGRVTILNREGLEAASCECYRMVRSEFERLVGAPAG